MKKYLGKTGYQLQTQRIKDIPRAKLTRSIKYPLISEPHHQSLFEAILHDSSIVRGTADIRQKNRPASLIDFWKECVLEGAVFQPTKATTQELIYSHEGRQTPAETIWQSLPPKTKQDFDKETFIPTFIITTRFRSPSTPASLKKKFTASLADPKSTAYDKTFEKLAHQLLKLNTKDQKKLLQKTFHFTPSENLAKSNSNLTIYFIPHWQRLENLEDALTRLNQLSLKLNQNTQDLLGLSKNANALSNFFNYFLTSLQAEKIHQLCQELGQTSDYWTHNQTELETKLKRLAQTAQRLPEKPALASNWADYRTMVGGKLSSWLTNFSKRQELIQNYLEPLETELSKATQVQSKTKSLPIAETLALISDLKTNGLRQEQYNLLTDLLAEIRRQLNILLQDKPKQKSQETNHLKNYPTIFAKTPKLSQFYGDSRQALVEKYYDAPVQLQEINQKITQITAWLQTKDFARLDESHFRQYLDRLASLTNRANSNLFSHQLNTFLHQYTQKIPKYKSRYRFYISPFARGRFKQIKFPCEYTQSDSEALIALAQSLLKTTDWLKLNTPQRIDAIEAAKVCLGLLVAQCQDYADFSPSTSSLLSKYTTYVGTVTDWDAARLARLVQQTLLSEAKGIASMMSRQEVIVRNQVNPIVSEKKFVLGYAQDLSKKNYCVVLKNWVDETAHSGIFTSSKQANKTASTQTKGSLLKIRSSKYQLQFLDWFLGKTPKSKKGLTLTRLSPALITEERVKINWPTQASQKVTLESISNQVFFNQPFVIENSVREKTSSPFEANKYIGFDIGEYGVAYAVVDISKNKVALGETGFVHSQGMKLIRDHVSTLKNQQLKGTFSVSSTRLKRLRDDTANSLRNKLHELALRYHAKPVYEWQISAFETGSNRTVTLYNTIKRSDIYAKIEAESGDKERIWGNKFAKIGTEINARLTSQTCTKCKRTISDEETAVRYLHQHPTLERVSIFAGKDSQFWAFAVEKKYRINDVSYSQIHRNVYDIVRPPNGSTVLDYFKVELDDNWFKKRGNSGVFICPYLDCNHVSDADIQASYVIACRAYLREKENVTDSYLAWKNLAMQEIKIKYR